MMDVDTKPAVRLLETLRRLLEIDAIQVQAALEEASQLVAEALDADKVDTFLFDETISSLVAVGVSDTPMGRRQKALGLDRLPVANGGPTVQVFQTGEPQIIDHADQREDVPIGISQDLGVRSMLLAPLSVAGSRRGTLSVSSAQPEAFTGEDLQFLIAVAHWVGVLAHRAELVERIAEDAAERGRQMLAEELISVLAHDLGNYITPIRGRLDLLRRRAKREERERDAQDMTEALRGVDRIQKLVANLLDASRFEQGLFSLATQRVDLTELVRDTVSLLTQSDTGVAVRAPEPLEMEVDPDRMRQVIENLVTNAAKYAPGVPVTVEVRREEQRDGSKAVIEVSDQGPGIGPELIPTLFHRFRTGPGSKGLGLGLYLARSIVVAHGGDLSVESEPGRGATFRVVLPFESRESGVLSQERQQIHPIR